MIPENIKKIVDQLIIKTDNNQTLWNKSSGANSYRLLLKSATISVDTWWNDNQEESMLDITITNDTGDIIEYVMTGENSDKDDYKYLFNFYSIIKRKYFRVDETLKGLLEEINNDKPIGKQDTSSPPSADDLPF